MKPRAWWQNGLVYLGYTAFFVFAFISCIYLTLPLDALQGYLVRKLSDEHGMDLTVERLSTWRLTGFEAENVVIRPRPSPEELAAITAAREARKAWDEQHKGKGDRGDKAEKSDAGATPGEPAAALGKAPTDAPKAGAPEPPTVPAGPAPIEAARLQARLGILGLLKGDLALDVRAEMLGGTLNAEIERLADSTLVKADWDALDLRQIPQIKEALQVPVVGAFAGNVSLDVPTTDDKKPRWANATGTVEVKVLGASVGPGRIESKKLGAFGFLDVPMARIAGIEGKLTFDKKKAVVDKFDITGKDLEGEVTGHLVLDNALEKWAPRLHARFKVSDEFLEAHKDVKVALSASAWLKQGQADGYTGISINGTFKSPTFNPKKESPYKKGGDTSARVESGDARKSARDKKAGAKGGASKTPPPRATPPAPIVPQPEPPRPAEPEPAPEPAAPEPAPEPAAPEPEPEAPVTEAPAEEPTPPPPSDDENAGE
jgi:type II secretion system protein N